MVPENHPHRKIDKLVNLFYLLATMQKKRARQLMPLINQDVFDWVLIRDKIRKTFRAIGESEYRISLVL